MNKWQLIDYIYWNLDALDERDIWDRLDDINDSTAIAMMSTWLYKSRPPGDVFIKAQGILEWNREKGFITPKQRRWLLLAMCSYWDTTSCQLYNGLVL